jgi:hypothetical protein
MKKFEVGEQVRPSLHYRLQFPSSRVTKLDGEGTVVRIDPETGWPYVKWDCRKTADRYHPKFIAQLAKDW